MFFEYIRALGTLFTILWFIFFIGYQLFSVLSNIWLSEWTEDPVIANASIVDTPYYTDVRNMYLGVYGGLGGLQGRHKNHNTPAAIFFLELYHSFSLYSCVCAPVRDRDRHQHGASVSRATRTHAQQRTPLAHVILRYDTYRSNPEPLLARH